MSSCVTPCDKDCTAACHQVHHSRLERTHEVASCPGWLSHKTENLSGLDVIELRTTLARFLIQLGDKLDSYEIWGGPERPAHVLTLGQLRTIHRRL